MPYLVALKKPRSKKLWYVAPDHRSGFLTWGVIGPHRDAAAKDSAIAITPNSLADHVDGAFTLVKGAYKGYDVLVIPT